MTRETVHRVRGPALRALASPARLELVQSLMRLQPASVGDLAADLGREPGALYHHLRPLLAHGVIVEEGRRATGKRPATLYHLPADRIELDPTDRSRPALEARRRLARAVLRAALARNEAALDDPATRLSGKRRELLLAHRAVRLRPRGLARANEKLAELLELLGEEHDPSGESFVLTVQLAPDRERDAPGG